MNIRQAGNSPFFITFSVLFAFGICITGCHNSTKQDSPAVAKRVSIIELLIGNGEHTFRMSSLGDDPKTVAKSERKAADETDTNYISYSLPLDTLHADSVNEEIDSLNYFTIAYNFDQQKLNEIDEDVFLATDSAAATVARRITDYLTNKYGDGAQGPDSMVWSYTKNGKKIKIALSDQSEEYDYGKLSLVFYSEDY